MDRRSATVWVLFLVLYACSGSDSPSTSTSPSPAPSPSPVPAVDLTTFGSDQGLTGKVIDANPDDNQNIWAATPEALYVLRPGDAKFKRFTAADGLHIQSFIAPNGQPAVTSITSMAGGAWQ